MLLSNKNAWRITTWPVLVIIAIHFAYYPYGDQAMRLWAQEPPSWSGEVNVPVEWSTEGRGIQSKAGELGNHPVLIYEFARNEIEYEAYAGSRFGAVGTLERGRGNDVDQAMLLAALLRAAYRNLVREEPDVRLVQGDVRLTGLQALEWLGVENGEAVRAYLNSAGVRHRIEGNPSGTNFELILLDHVWLRGDLEFGPYRGTRFVEGDDGILADLDPSFVIKEQIEVAPLPFELSRIEPKGFAEHVAGYAKEDEAEGSAENIPEAYMLDQIESGAAVFHNMLEEKSLTVVQALEQRRPTIETIQALPDALPYGLENDPVVYKLSFDAPNPSTSFLEMARHRLEVRVALSDDNSTLAEAIMPTSSLYARRLAIAFESDDELTTGDLTLSQIPTALWENRTLRTHIRIDSEDKDPNPTPPSVGYGARVRIEWAYQPGRLDAGGALPNPLNDPTTDKESLETVAGGLFVIAAIPGLNESTSSQYYSDQVALSSTTSGSGRLVDINPGMNASSALGPSLDLAAQVIVAQTEDFFTLGSLAGGHRTSSVGQWALVGLEPVPYNDGIDSGLERPRFVFATSRGKAPLGRIVADDDPRHIESPALDGLLQLAREALLVHGPAIALGTGVYPVSPGRLIREANAASLPIYAVNRTNASLLNQGGDRVPMLGGASLVNLQALADQDHLLVMASARAADDPGGADPKALGQGWGYLSRDPANEWNATVWPTVSVEPLRAFSEQYNTSALSPGDLIFGGMAMGYQRLATQSISGVESYSGAVKPTGRAFVAAVHPLAELMGPTGMGHASVASTQALNLGATVIALHALLEEFSRPEVLSLELELFAGGESTFLKPGEPFNPTYWDKIIARGEFNQTLDDYLFLAYDGPNNEVGSFASEGQLLVRTGTWTLKGDGASTDTFAFVTNGPDDYNGPFEIRLEGKLDGRKTRPFSTSFIIDTSPPDLDLIAWDSGREYRGAIAVRGSANDLHFDSYEVHLDDDPPTGSWRYLNGGSEAIAGVGLLAAWPADVENANGGYTVKLSAVDLAGNSDAITEVLTVRNDGLDPVLVVNQPLSGPLNGSVSLIIDATDAQTPIDSGVRKFRVEVDYSRSYLDKAKDNAFTVAPASAVLFDQVYDPPVSSAHFNETIDTLFYQGHGFSGLTLRAYAEDAFGNRSELTRAYTLNNTLFNVSLSRSTLASNTPPIFVNIYQSMNQTPIVQLMTSDGSQTWILNESVSMRQVYADTHFVQYKWEWEDNFTTAEGRYRIRVAQGSEEMNFDVFILPSSPIAGYLHNPMHTILLKDKTPTIDITGFVTNAALSFNDLSPGVPKDDADPIEVMLEASRPYWHLSYKSHSAPPVIENYAIPEGFFFDNVLNGNEANWIELAHGFSEVPLLVPDPDCNQNGIDDAIDIANGELADLDGDGIPDQCQYQTLAQWQISKLPSGLYDVRLLTTDGYNYLTAVVPGYNIRHSASIPGEPDGGRTPGVLALRQVDFSVQFEGFPIEIARSYSSFRANLKRDFGYGWRFEGVDLKIETTANPIDELGDQRLEAEITLPDGRRFIYANEPPTVATLGYNHAQNAWYFHNAFLSRPYGQMLWVPGRSTPYMDPFQVAYPNDIASTVGYKKIFQFRLEMIAAGDPYNYVSATPDGSLACLQLEDGSFLIYKWDTGRFLRQDAGDAAPTAPPLRHVDFDYASAADTVSITDSLDRGIEVHRNSDGFIDRITDPRGFSFTYEYNGKDELAKITDRAGGVRRLYYEHKDYDHFLTRMVIERGGVETEIVYEYNLDSRLSRIDTGDGIIDMEYLDRADGSGIQTVVDKDTGGTTEVHYDPAGRVTLQEDPAGNIQTYEYFPDDSQDFLTEPGGVLKKQTTQGITTEFEYDLFDYQVQTFGIEGIAENFVKFWTNRASGGVIVDDFISGEILPGYLTTQQVQPTMMMTPAVENGVVLTETNDIGIGYYSGVGTPDGTGKIYGINDPEGRAISLGYGSGVARNEMVSLSAAGGADVTNTYVPSGDFAGRLLSSVATPPSGDPTSTAYSYARGVPSTFAAFNAEIQDAIPDLSTRWPSFSPAWIEEHIVTVDTGGDVTVSTSYLDAGGNTVGSKSDSDEWSFTLFDAEGRLIYSVAPSGSIAQSEYDAAGLLVRSISNEPGEAAVTTLYVYDEQGRQLSITRDGDLVSSTAYGHDSPAGRERTVTDAAGNRTTTVTDGAGRVVEERFEGVEGSRRTTGYEYDDNGRRFRVTSARGLVTETEFDAAGRAMKTTRTAGGRVIVEERGYDRYGRTLWTQTPLQAQATQPIFSTYLYETSVPVTDPAYGQLLQVFHEDDDQKPANNDPSYEGYYELYGYDTEGRQVTVTKPVQTSQAATPVAVTTRTTYDAEGRVATVTMADGSPEAIAFTFAYDAEGNRESVTYPSGIVKRWDRTYDAQENLTQVIESQPGPAAAPPAWKTTDYDPETGRRTSLTDAVGNSIAYTYDGFRLEGETYTPIGGQGASHNVQFTEVNDLVRTVETWAGDAQTTLLRSETHTGDPETGGIASVSKPEGTIDYGYDNAGSLSSMSYLGRTLLYKHDFFGRLKSAEAPEGQWEYQYNDAGQKVRVTNRKNASHEERTYDALGRLLSVSHVNDATGAVIFQVDYVLGEDGNRIGALETRGTNTVRWDYEYDLLRRLTREKRDVGNNNSLERDVSYSYDVDGNRDDEVDHLPGGETRHYVYEANSHRLDKIEVAGASVEDFAWTANGELASKTDSSGVTTYLWGPDGTLAEVQLPGGESIQYEYDHAGELIARRAYDAQGTLLSDDRYLIDHVNLTGFSQRLAEIDGLTGTIKCLNTFADRVMAQTKVETGGGFVRQTLHADGLGSIRHLTGTDASGSTLDEAFDYEAFGSLIAGDRSLTEYAFTSQIADASSGVQYHRARWLSPGEGAWLSGDPVFDFPGNFGNSFVYTSQNPVSFIDRSGTLTLTEVVIVSGIIGILTGAGFSALHYISTGGNDLLGTLQAFGLGFALGFMGAFLISLAVVPGASIALIAFLSSPAVTAFLLSLLVNPKWIGAAIIALLGLFLMVFVTALIQFRVTYDSWSLDAVPSRRSDVEDAITFIGNNVDTSRANALSELLDRDLIRFDPDPDAAEADFAQTAPAGGPIVLRQSFFELTLPFQAWILYHEQIHVEQNTRSPLILDDIFRWEKEPYRVQWSRRAAFGILGAESGVSTLDYEAFFQARYVAAKYGWR